MVHGAGTAMGAPALGRTATSNITTKYHPRRLVCSAHTYNYTHSKCFFAVWACIGLCSSIWHGQG